MTGLCMKYVQFFDKCNIFRVIIMYTLSKWSKLFTCAYWNNFLD